MNSPPPHTPSAWSGYIPSPRNNELLLSTPPRLASPAGSQASVASSRQEAVWARNEAAERLVREGHRIVAERLRLDQEFERQRAETERTRAEAEQLLERRRLEAHQELERQRVVAEHRLEERYAEIDDELEAAGNHHLLQSQSNSPSPRGSRVEEWVAESTHHTLSQQGTDSLTRASSIEELTEGVERVPSTRWDRDAATNQRMRDAPVWPAPPNPTPPVQGPRSPFRPLGHVGSPLRVRGTGPGHESRRSGGIRTRQDLTRRVPLPVPTVAFPPPPAARGATPPPANAGTPPPGGHSSPAEIAAAAAAAVASALAVTPNPLVGLQTQQLAYQMVTQCRPKVKFSGEGKQDFEQALKELEAALQTPGMTEMMKLNELPHWFSGPAGLVVTRFSLRKDAKTALEEAIEQLTLVFGRRWTTADEMLETLLVGDKVSVKDTASQLSFVLKLENAYALALETNRAPEFD